MGMALLTFDRQGQIRGVNALGNQIAKLAPDWEPVRDFRANGGAVPSGADGLGLVVGVFVMMLGFVIGQWVIGVLGLIGTSSS